MDRWRRLLPLVGWLGALASGLVLFHALGRGALAPPPLTDIEGWGPWLAAREPTLAAIAVLRLVVLALAWYLVGATAVGIVARLVDVAGLIRVADALTLPMVRRLLQAALGISLASAMVGASTAPAARHLEAPRPTVAAEQPTMRAVDDGGDDARPATDDGPVAMRLVEQERRRATSPGPTGRATSPGPTAGDDEAAAAGGAEAGTSDVEADPAPLTHRVATGESLWSIAHDALVRRWGREPTDAEVVDYWRVVIERNRSSLADPENPDLIFPGDEIVLPPWSAT